MNAILSIFISRSGDHNPLDRHLHQVQRDSGCQKLEQRTLLHNPGEERLSTMDLKIIEISDWNRSLLCDHVLPDPEAKPCHLHFLKVTMMLMSRVVAGQIPQPPSIYKQKC